MQFRDSLAKCDKGPEVAGSVTAFPKDLMRDCRALGVPHDRDCVAAVLEPVEVAGDPGAHGRERYGQCAST